MSRPIAIIICLTFAIISAIALVFPKKGELDSLNKKVNEKKSDLQSKEVYFASLEKTFQELENYPVQLSKISSAFPSSSQFPALFDFLQKASSQTGMVLTDVSPLSGKLGEKGESMNENAINLRVSGNYPNFRNFLKVLEESSRLIEVENISFNSQEKNPEFGLKIKVYFY